MSRRGCSDARLARRDRLRGHAAASRPHRLRRLRACDQHPARARRAHRCGAGVEDRPGRAGVVLDDHCRRLPCQRVRGLRPSDAVRVGGSRGIRDQGGNAATRDRGLDRRRVGWRRLDRGHRLLRRVRGRGEERGHHLRAQRQRGVHEHRRSEVRRDPGGRVDDDDTSGCDADRAEEGPRAHHGRPRHSLCRDACSRVGADAA